ncbi:MAG: FecR family protein [Rhodanobacter sp.]
MSDSKLHMASVGDPVRHTAAAWFTRLRADDVSERERSEFQRWLTLDAGHRAAYERMEALWTNLGAYAGRSEIDEALHANDARRPRHTANTKRNGVRRARVWATAAAVALVVFAGGWFAQHRQQIEPHTYVTRVGERRTLLLDDGSQVTMDTDTRLTTAFSAHARRLTLERGRAFFRVAKNADRPFFVTTQNGVVRAVGTQFDVYEHDDEVEVALIEGRVIVATGGDGVKPEIQTTMEAGQRLVMGKTHSQPVFESADANATAWLSGKLVFNDTPLRAVVAQFNRYSSHKIIIDDDATARLHVSGVFRSDDNHAFVDALCATYDLAAKQSVANEWVLSTKTVR